MEELKHKLSNREDKSKKHYGDREDRGRDKAKRKEREKSSKIRDKVKEIRDEDEKVRDKVKEREERERKREHEKDKEDREERERRKEHLKDKKYREEREREKEGKKDGEKDKEDMRERKRELERVKEDCEERERKREREKVKEDRKERERRREREKEGNYDERPKEREKSSKIRDEDEKVRDRVKEREKDKEDREERERERKKEREKEKEDRDERERKKEREKEKEDREERERERKREREKEKEDREERERERERRKEKERREREKERIREKDRYKGSDDEVDRERKRRKRDSNDEHYKERGDRERSSKTSNRLREGSIDQVSAEKNEKSREEDLAEEQRKLDDEMEKRRRRVQEWQELKRKKEESEREKLGVDVGGEEPKLGKTWTLDGESDDEDAEGKNGMDIDMDDNGKVMKDENGAGKMVSSSNGSDSPVIRNGGDGVAADDDEIDPLDAFMNSMVLPEVEKLSKFMVNSLDAENSSLKEKNGPGKEEKPKMGVKMTMKKTTGRIIPGEDSDSDYGDVENDEDTLEEEDDEEFMKRVKKTKVEKLSLVDHSKIDYPSFRKNFYIEVKEISRMSPEEVSAYRKELELKIHGKDVPKPIRTWHQTGLSSKILDTIRKLNYEKPMSIQAQALPVIMSGRDCIGIAKTGSGKTLAFVLPMLRHIKDQPPLASGDGPIGLIMAPTRELVQQIHSDIKKFARVMGLTCVPVYGGSGVAQQISELKRGAEIVVCTPGRMIDILCTSGGKITNLRRVTYLVMDEADRMFDMGFEPQITRIVQNTQPDRQTVLFSATFPRQVEILARKVLNKPVEIQVGGRSVVNRDITQLVEVRPESDRFLRLLELLGEWFEKGKILIFVHTQDKCDSLFRELLKHGYGCLSLHGAKDQTDRESTISDFKSDVCNLLIATSIAARGLDVKELELVINYDVPNHYEDYVHRVGRTGRAGRKGCAITFISEDDARYAPDLVKALQLSEQVVPDDLKALADSFNAKVNQGLEQAHGTGYGGSGFKFNEEEDEVRRAAKKAQAKEYGFEEDKSDSEDEDEGIRKAGGDLSQQAALAQAAALVAASKASMASAATPVSVGQLLPNGGLPVSLPGVLGINIPVGSNDVAARATAIAAAMNLQHNLAKIQADAMPEHYEAELEINDFPQNARWKVTHKETLGPISDWTGAAITTRGQYVPPGKVPGFGERKLYLFIEGPTEQSVKRAKAELKRVLEDITMQASSLPGLTRYMIIRTDQPCTVKALKLPQGDYTVAQEETCKNCLNFTMHEESSYRHKADGAVPVCAMDHETTIRAKV
ncbi:DEAD-box ATP-dependent RNA helicase 42, partial [Capsicum chinense]